MSNKLSPAAVDILDGVLTALQNAEELGGVDGTPDYLLLMEAVATFAVNCHNNANSESELRLTKIDA